MMARRARVDADLLSAQQAADFLGVTTTRLRDMLDEGKIVATAVGDRFSAYSRAELQRYQFTRGGGQASPVSELLDAPPRPLSRKLDQVIRISEPYSPTHAAHLRVFEGPTTDGALRTAVVLGAITDELSMPTAEWGPLASYVDAEFLQGQGINAVWYLLDWTDLDGFEIDNVVMVRRRRPVDMFRRMLTGRAAALEDGNDYNEPAFRPTTVAEIERVIGGPLEAYPRAAYTEQAIRRWQMLGKQVDIEYDQAGLRPLLAALSWLDGNSDLRAKDACKELAREITVLREMVDRGEWNDGTSPKFEGQSRSWPRHFAARLVKPHFSSYEEKLIALHDVGESWPWSADYLADYRQRMLDLRDWREQVDEFADKPDKDLAAALSVVISLMRRWIVVAVDHQRRNESNARQDLTDEDPYPVSSPRLYKAIGPHDKKYLAGVRWEPGHQPVSRDHRRIAGNLGGMYKDHPEDWRFGVDQFDHAVAHRAPAGDLQFDWICVCWPHTAPVRGLPDGSFIVADRAGHGQAGDRPAYIQYPDAALDLLPSRLNDPGWSFGYGGSSPGRLAASISDLVQRVDQIPQSAVPTTWIDDAVHHSDPEKLLIAVDDIRRRVAAG